MSLNFRYKIGEKPFLVICNLFSFGYIYGIIVITAFSDQHANALRVCTQHTFHFQQVLHQINIENVSSDLIPALLTVRSFS